MLAKKLGWEFADADDFHSAANKEKIKHGIPLTDADRKPWLAALHEEIKRRIAAKRNTVLACSALKESYRETLWNGPEVKLVFLKGPYQLVYRRLVAASGILPTSTF